MRKVTLVNPCPRDNRAGLSRYGSERAFILWFGAYGETRLLVYARHLEDALDECVGWIADHKPGLFCDDAVEADYLEGISEGLSEDEAIEQAEADMTVCDGGHYLAPWEWGVLGEDLTPKQIADYVHER